MAKFLSTRATSTHIAQIINYAKRYVVLISPSLGFSPLIFKFIIEGAERGTRTVIVYGEDCHESGILSELQKIPNIELYFIKDLHAKCYFNEDSMILSSMNLREFLEVNNWEMSIFMEKANDEEVFLSVVNDVKRNLDMAFGSLGADPLTNSFSQGIANDTPVLVIDLRKRMKQALKSLTANGVCIRCGQKIFTDYDKPYCNGCYNSWLKFENYDHREKKCHLCGANAKTTIENPLCRKCFDNILTKVGKI